MERTLYQLEELCLAHHQGLQRSSKTFNHHRDSFRLMDEYLESVGCEPTSKTLTTQTFQGLVA